MSRCLTPPSAARVCDPQQLSRSAAVSKASRSGLEHAVAGDFQSAGISTVLRLVLRTQPPSY